MVDFVKAYYRPPPGADAFKYIQGIQDVLSTYSNDTGREIAREGTINDIIKIKQFGDKIQIQFSLHQYHNWLISGTKTNNNRFTYQECNEVLKSLSKVLRQPLNEMTISVLECGINIPYPYDICDLLEVEIVYRKGIGQIIYNTVRDAYFEQDEKRMKIYSKPYDGNQQIRFEKKFKKHRQLKSDIGIETLADLTDRQTFHRMKDDLVKGLDSILIIDIESRKSRHRGIRKFRNKTYWDDTRSDVRKALTRETFSKRWKKALNQSRKYGFDKKKNTLKNNMLHEFEKIMNPETKAEAGLTNSPLSIRGKCQPIIRRCKVTGIDISGQRKGSKFVSKKTVANLYKNDIDTYRKLEGLYLPIKKRNSKLERRAYYIAHNVRNQYQRMNCKTNQDSEVIPLAPNIGRVSQICPSL